MTTNMKGYQVVEIESLDKFITSEHLSTYISLLIWVASCINNMPKLSTHIQVDVIKVEYLGAYPALGIKYLAEGQDDFEPVVHEEYEKLVAQTSVYELLKFIETNEDEIARIRDMVDKK